jgi:hypothetical protein
VVAECGVPGAIYNHMSAIHDTLPLLRLLLIAYQDVPLLLLLVPKLQPRTRITMDRLTQLQDTLDDVGDLCDKLHSNTGH